MPKIVCASSGNHAGACCKVWKNLGFRGIVYVPQTITDCKLKKFQNYSDMIDVHIVGEEVCQTENIARRFADQNNMPYISPYNDYDVICGQGTIAMEIVNELPDVNAIFAPCGGGALVGGIATYLKSIGHAAHVVACQPEEDAVMYQSVKAGRILTYEEAGSKPTICQATSGGVEEDSLTYDLCRDYVDNWVFPTEIEIALSLLELADNGIRVETSCALPLAALKKTRQLWEGKNIVLILSSGNLGEDELIRASNIVNQEFEGTSK